MHHDFYSSGQGGGGRRRRRRRVEEVDGAPAAVPEIRRGVFVCDEDDGKGCWIGRKGEDGVGWSGVVFARVCGEGFEEGVSKTRISVGVDARREGESGGCCYIRSVC